MFHSAIVFLFATTFISTCTAASVIGYPMQAATTTTATTVADNVNWNPADGLWADWIKCHGMSCDDWEIQQEKMQQLNQLLGISNPAPAVTTKKPASGSGSGGLLGGLLGGFQNLLGGDDDGGSTTVPSPPSNLFQNCILFTPVQLDAMINALTGNRKKRTLIDFTIFPASKWTSPIYFKFDGTHNTGQQAIIRGGVQHWMAQTCVQFVEIPAGVTFPGQALVFTAGLPGRGCFSNVGRTTNINQMINLDVPCTLRYGTPVHEIGHALGLVHEQMRADRNDYITVFTSNIVSSYLPQFTPFGNLNPLGVPYDLGSVMQYPSIDGVSNDGLPTMVAKDPFYQQNMGQRVGLSFFDTKVINLAYCLATCPNPLSQPCLRGGYVDPKNCSQCRCPDGFSGTYCQLVAPSVNAVCGGVINLVTGQQQVVKSPGYDSPKYYQSYTECSWWLKAPPGQQLQLTFAGAFGMYCQTGACYHWAEIKYKADLGLAGGRFCCYTLPNVTITSESNEMMIVFKSNDTAAYSAQTGFQAIISVVGTTSNIAPAAVIPPTSTPTTTPTTTTTTTTTTTPPPTTTTTTTTTPTPTTTRTPTTTTTTVPTTTTNTPTTIPTVVQPGHVSIPAQLNVAFLIDLSVDYGTTNWQRVQTFIAQTISRFSISQNGVHVGLVTFATTATKVLGLTDSYDSNKIIASLPTGYQPGATNMAAAINMARTQIFVGPAATSNIPNVCILVTSGTSTTNQDVAQTEASLARAAGIKMIVAAIGYNTNGTEVSGIAGSDTNVEYIGSFSEFDATPVNGGDVDRLVQKISTPNVISTGTTHSTLWQCSFEPSATDVLCGMQQDETNDQFDWTVYQPPTPSDPTGPDFAYDANYYIYIEASDPRLPNDTARLYFPNLSNTYTGPACLDFYYHMYGFHINTLTIMQTTNSFVNTIWKRTGDMGNVWRHSFIDINIQPNSQLQMIASRGLQYSGDIGADLLSIRTGSCT